MKKITQEAHFRQRMLTYAKSHGVTETANQYHVCRKTVWKWGKRWDGTTSSLEDQSRRPRYFPNAQTAEEIATVCQYRKKYGDDLILAYQKACEKNGYSRSYGCFKRTAEKEQPISKPRKKRKNKPYQRAEYPGQKIQLDVKYVPTYCVTNGQKYYQYTAKDECTRWTYREMYEEHSTYSSKTFLENFVKAAPFPVRMIQTDNGTEFTNALLVVKATQKTMFEEALLDMGIEYHRIRIATPRHNGKVERRHMTMYSLSDGRKQLARYQKCSNSYIMTCLGMKSPNQILARYQWVM